MSAPQQKDLFTDLPRGEQLQALRRLKLDAYKHRGRSVSGAVCKSVLRAIDDRAGDRGCFASQATLAEEVGVGVATVSRAIAALVAQDLITIEKVNPWSPNTHRVNWTAVYSVSGRPRSDGRRQGQSLPTAKSVMAVGQDRDSLRPRPLAPTAIQIAPLIDQINAPTNRPDEWAAVAAEIFDWGMKSATTAVDAARERGMSVDLVRELWLESGGDREPKRWEPGQLANWLTGRTEPPFDHEAAIRRRDQRQHEVDRRANAEAERIRKSVQASGRGQPDWLVAGLTFRKLRDAGLESFATVLETDGGGRMDEIDRQRKNRTPGVNAPAIGARHPASEPRNAMKAPGGHFRPLGVPGVGLNQRRQEISRALLAIE